MKTVVVNFTHEQALFEPVMPLLFPLLRSGDLVVIPRQSGKLSKECCMSASQETLSALTRGADGDSSPQWRSVVVLALPKNECNGPNNRLAHQIEFIENFYLKPLREAHCIPQKTWVLVMDMVPRDLSNCPTTPLGLLAWEIDKNGFFSQQTATGLPSTDSSGQVLQDCLFSGDEIESLNQVWPEQVDLTGVDSSAGLNALQNATTRAAIIDGCEQVIGCLTLLVEQKKQAITKLTRGDDYVLFKPRRLESILKSFEDELESYKARNIWGFNNFKPAKSVGNIVRKHHSLHAVIEDTGARCLILSGTDSLLQQTRLIFLILFLAEHEAELPSNIPNLLQVETLSIDAQVMGSALGQWIDTWDAAKVALQRQYDAPPNAQFQFIDTETFPAGQTFPQLTEGHLKKVPDSAHAWESWRKSTLASMGAAVKKSEEQLNALAGELLLQISNPPVGLPKQYNLEAAVQEKKREAKAAADALLKTEYSPLAHDWQKKILPIDLQFQEVFVTRPTNSLIGKLVCLTFFALTVLYLQSLASNATFRELLPNVLFPCLGFLLAASSIAIWLFFREKLKIKSLIATANQLRENCLEKMKNSYSDGVIFIQSSYRCMAARRNLEMVEEEWQRVKEQQDRFVDVQRQCQAARDSFAGILGENNVHNTLPPEVSRTDKFIPCDQPFDKDPFFIPEGWTSEPQSCILSVDGSRKTITSRLTPGLTLIKLSGNTIFS